MLHHPDSTGETGWLSGHLACWTQESSCWEGLMSVAAEIFFQSYLAVLFVL